MHLGHSRFPLVDLVSHVNAVLLSVVPTAKLPAEQLDAGAALNVWKRHRTDHDLRPKAIWDEQENCYFGFFYDWQNKNQEIPSIAFKIRTNRKPSPAVVQFLRMFFAIIDKDHAVLSSLNDNWEDTWASLKATQFQRSIARCLGFDALDANSWISMMESAANMTYEGTASQITVVIPKKITDLRASVGIKAYISLGGYIDLREALFDEKWVRAMVDGHRVALVADKRNRGRVSGFLSLTVLPECNDPNPYAPHESLRLLQAHLSTGGIALTMAANRDLYVMSGKGVFWRKHQGRWRIIDCNILAQELEASLLSPRIALEITRMCLDLSFERKGALICIVDPEITDLPALVVDYDAEARVNAPLRRALQGANVTEWGKRQIISAAAGTDGATIIDQNGKVRDIACMVADPPPYRLKAAGFSVCKAFAGARSRAAWNASLFGIAIKVSEDGPISMMKAGREVCTIG